jgi:hypothetical protein
LKKGRPQGKGDSGRRGFYGIKLLDQKVVDASLFAEPNSNEEATV